MRHGMWLKENWENVFYLRRANNELVFASHSNISQQVLFIYAALLPKCHWLIVEEGGEHIPSGGGMRALFAKTCIVYSTYITYIRLMDAFDRSCTSQKVCGKYALMCLRVWCGVNCPYVYTYDNLTRHYFISGLKCVFQFVSIKFP